MHLPFFTYRDNPETISIGTSFIVSDPGNPILMLNRDLLFEYWREHNYYTHYFIFNIFFEMAAEKFRSEYDKMPFLSYKPQSLLSSKIWADEDYSEEKMKRLAELSDWHKLTYKKLRIIRCFRQKLFQT